MSYEFENEIIFQCNLIYNLCFLQKEKETMTDTSVELYSVCF